MRRKKFGSQIETKEVLHILGMAHPAAPGIGKVHSSNRPCRRRYFDRSPGKKKHMVYSGVGVVLGFDIHVIRLYFRMKTRAFIVSLKHVDL